jgi:hypothetical protein
MPRRRRAAAAPETRPAGSLWNAGADEPSSAALRARVRPPPARKVDCRPPHGARKSAAALLDAVDFPGTNNSTADFLQSSRSLRPNFCQIRTASDPALLPQIPLYKAGIPVCTPRQQPRIRGSCRMKKFVSTTASDLSFGAMRACVRGKGAGVRKRRKIQSNRLRRRLVHPMGRVCH